MGRPAHKPDPTSRRQVEAMTAYGVPETDIATVIGVDPKTLRKHYRSELDTGEIKANSKVAESLYRKALGDGSQSVTAAIFWLKTRARWREAPQTLLQGRVNRTTTASDSPKAFRRAGGGGGAEGGEDRTSLSVGAELEEA